MEKNQWEKDCFNRAPTVIDKLASACTTPTLIALWNVVLMQFASEMMMDVGWRWSFSWIMLALVDNDRLKISAIIELFTSHIAMKIGGNKAVSPPAVPRNLNNRTKTCAAPQSLLIVNLLRHRKRLPGHSWSKISFPPSPKTRNLALGVKRQRNWNWMPKRYQQQFQLIGLNWKLQLPVRQVLLLHSFAPSKLHSRDASATQISLMTLNSKNKLRRQGNAITTAMGDEEAFN